jgi:hypothetical protein
MTFFQTPSQGVILFFDERVMEKPIPDALKVTMDPSTYRVSAFDRAHGQREFADCWLVVRDNSPPDKPREILREKGHRFILSVFEYCRRIFDVKTWPGKQEIEESDGLPIFPVDSLSWEDEWAARGFRLLLWHAYAMVLEPTGTSSGLVGANLADRYPVTSLPCACSKSPITALRAAAGFADHMMHNRLLDHFRAHVQAKKYEDISGLIDSYDAELRHAPERSFVGSGLLLQVACFHTVMRDVIMQYPDCALARDLSLLLLPTERTKHVYRQRVYLIHPPNEELLFHEPGPDVPNYACETVDRSRPDRCNFTCKFEMKSTEEEMQEYTIAGGRLRFALYGLFKAARIRDMITAHFRVVLREDPGGHPVDHRPLAQVMPSPRFLFFLPGKQRDKMTGEPSFLAGRLASATDDYYVSSGVEDRGISCGRSYRPGYGSVMTASFYTRCKKGETFSGYVCVEDIRVSLLDEVKDSSVSEPMATTSTTTPTTTRTPAPSSPGGTKRKTSGEEDHNSDGVQGWISSDEEQEEKKTRGAVDPDLERFRSTMAAAMLQEAFMFGVHPRQDH